MVVGYTLRVSALPITSMATSKTRRMSQPERDFESVKATVGALASVQEAQGKQLDSIAKDVLAMRTALVGTDDPLNPSKGSLAAISETENLLARHIKATAEEFAKQHEHIVLAKELRLRKLLEGDRAIHVDVCQPGWLEKKWSQLYLPRA